MEKKIQKMRFTDEEMSLIKNTFADNEDLLKAIRKVFLQKPLDVLDKSALKNHVAKKPDVVKAIRKVYLPELDENAPVHQVIDLWMTIEIKDKSPEEAYPHIIARERLIKYLEQQLQVLETLDDAGTIRLKDVTKGDWARSDEFNVYVDLMWRNTLIAHNEQQLAQLAVLAGQKTETVEQTKDRLKKQSSK